jgi:hypothetical protein
MPGDFLTGDDVIKQILPRGYVGGMSGWGFPKVTSSAETHAGLPVK